MREQGRCRVCGKPVCAASVTLCERHRKVNNKRAREYMRRRLGCRRRRLSAESYGW